MLIQRGLQRNRLQKYAICSRDAIGCGRMSRCLGAAKRGRVRRAAGFGRQDRE